MSGRVSAEKNIPSVRIFISLPFFDSANLPQIRVSLPFLPHHSVLLTLKILKLKDLHSLSVSSPTEQHNNN